MKLNRRGTDWYQVAIDSTPTLAGWEASFDDGTTWKPSESGGPGLFRWLVAGPDAPAGSAPVITASIEPLLRAPDGSATPVRRGPAIELEY
jgi:hypothetical protein